MRDEFSVKLSKGKGNLYTLTLTFSDADLDFL